MRARDLIRSADFCLSGCGLDAPQPGPLYGVRGTPAGAGHARVCDGPLWRVSAQRAFLVLYPRGVTIVSARVGLIIAGSKTNQPEPLEVVKPADTEAVGRMK
jgi:hypothetical protein